MEINNIFESRPASIYDVLSKNGTCLYLPAFQRAYRWTKDNRKTLLKDICISFNGLINSEQSIAFIGSVIFIDDRKRETIDPIVKTETPSSVLVVIDGQQRLTSLVLLFLSLHNLIKEKLKKNKLDGETTTANEFEKTLKARAKDVLESLKKSIYDVQSNGSEINKCFPKIIRAFEDQWAYTDGFYKYNSPIAYIVRKFIEHNNSSQVNKFKIPSDLGNDLNKNLIEDVYKAYNDFNQFISKLVSSASTNEVDEDLNIPSFEDLIKNEELQEILFSFKFPKPIEMPSEGQVELFKLLCFTLFSLKRVALTEVKAKNEEYAYDMFESLNTTGELLTPFETFKPKIIAAEGMTKYEKSISKEYTTEIEEILNKSNSKEKGKDINETINAFALSIKGEKVPQKFSDQRRFLTNNYKTCETIEDKRKFLKRLCDVAKFRYSVWLEKDNSIREDGIIVSDMHLFFLKILHDADHKIILPILTRIYYQVKGKANIESQKNVSDTLNCLIGFFILWRGSKPNTSGIDNIHRNIFIDSEISEDLKNFKDEKTIQSKNIIDYYKKCWLAEEINEHSWIEKVSVNEIYEISKPLTKLMLLISMENTGHDENQLGLIKKIRPSGDSILSTKYYEELKTIEHIAPQTKNRHWNTDLYEGNLIHTLGNLTLLPRETNSSLSDRPWSDKVFLFKCLSCKNYEEHPELKKEALVRGMSEDLQPLKRFSETLRMDHLLPLAKESIVWDAEFVKKRSKNLAKIIYDTCMKWLTYQQN